MRDEPEERHKSFLHQAPPSLSAVFDVENGCWRYLSGQILLDTPDAYGTVFSSWFECIGRDGHAYQSYKLILRQVFEGFGKIGLGGVRDAVHRLAGDRPKIRGIKVEFQLLVLGDEAVDELRLNSTE